MALHKPIARCLWLLAVIRKLVLSSSCSISKDTTVIHTGYQKDRTDCSRPDKPVGQGVQATGSELSIFTVSELVCVNCLISVQYLPIMLDYYKAIFTASTLTLNVLNHTTPHQPLPRTARSMQHQLLYLRYFEGKYEFLFYTTSATEDKYLRIKNQLITAQL